MTKNKMWDNSNMQEEIQWGNIELPGISDEVLLTKNWTKSEAIKQCYQIGLKVGTKGLKFSKESKQKLSKSLLGVKKSKNHKNNISSGKKGKYHGGNFKPIKTPYGVFSCIKEAGEYEYTLTGKKFNPNRFTNLLKDINSGYQYISIDEYNNLK